MHQMTNRIACVQQERRLLVRWWGRASFGQLLLSWQQTLFGVHVCSKEGGCRSGGGVVPLRHRRVRRRRRVPPRPVGVASGGGVAQQGAAVTSDPATAAAAARHRAVSHFALLCAT